MTNGLIRAGFHVLAGVDNELLCGQTYLQNRNRDKTSPQYICKDIFPQSANHPNGQQHEIVEHLHSALRDYRKRTKIRRLNLIFAICAPCQPFTKITKIPMSEGRRFKRGNDANLLLTTLNLVKEFRPDAIICENVEGIFADDSDSVLNIFRRRLRKAGYVFDAKIINAASYGIPQNRHRTIAIAFNSERIEKSFELPECDPSIKQAVTVDKIIGHLPALAAGEVHPSIPNHRARALSPLNLKRISCAHPGESNRYLRNTPYGDLSLACHRRLECKQGAPSFSDTYTRMRGNHVAPTITTKFISVTNGRFAHYDTKQNRALTPREAALLQTFPENYIFHPQDNIEFTATLIGNAVPPKLAEFFGRYIKRELKI